MSVKIPWHLGFANNAFHNANMLSSTIKMIEHQQKTNKRGLTVQSFTVINNSSKTQHVLSSAIK